MKINPTKQTKKAIMSALLGSLFMVLISLNQSFVQIIANAMFGFALCGFSTTLGDFICDAIEPKKAIIDPSKHSRNERGRFTPIRNPGAMGRKVTKHGDRRD